MNKAKKKIFIVTFLFFFTLLSHSSSIFNGFVWLDHIDIEHKNAVYPLENIGEMLTSPFGTTTFYRPFVSFMDSLDNWIYGAWAPGFHLTNNLIHAGVVVLAYLLLKKLINNVAELPAVLGALVVAVHPANLLPVAAISLRNEPLVLFWTLSSLLLFSNYLETSNKKWVYAMGISFLCALLSKETALLWVPSLITLFAFTKFKHQVTKSKIITTSSLMIIVSIIYTALRINAQSRGWGISPVSLTLSQALGTRIFVIAKTLYYYGFNPFVSPLSDAVKIVSLSDPVTIVSLCSGAMAVGAFYYFRRLPLTQTIAGIAAIALFPTTNIVPLPRFISMHYVYLLSFAIAVAVTGLLNSTIPAKKKIALYAIVFVWLILATNATFVTGYQYKNDKTLFLPEVQKDNHFLEGHFYLGQYYASQKEYEKALKAYKSALAKYPDYIAYVDSDAALLNTGAVYLLQKDGNAAEKIFEQALHIPKYENNARVLYNYAYSLYLSKKYTQLNTVLLERGSHAPLNTDSYILLAASLNKTGNKKESQELIAALESKEKNAEEEVFFNEIKKEINK